MKYGHGFFLYLVAFFFAPVLYGLFPNYGGALNLILCLTVILTLIYPDILPGLFFGPIFALLSDILYGQYIGVSALAIALTGIVVFIIREYVNIENVINAIIAMLFSTWLFVSINWGLYYLIGNRAYTYAHAMGSLPLQLVLNTVIGVMLYSVLIKRVIKHRKDRYFR